MERGPSVWDPLFPWGQRVNLPALAAKDGRGHTLWRGQRFWAHSLLASGSLGRQRSWAHLPQRGPGEAAILGAPPSLQASRPVYHAVPAKAFSEVPVLAPGHGRGAQGVTATPLAGRFRPPRARDGRREDRVTCARGLVTGGAAASPLPLLSSLSHLALDPAARLLITFAVAARHPSP